MPMSAAPAVPTGAMKAFAGSTAPAGYLLCYGQAISRATYAALFAVVSTAFGVGDGSTTFNIPDLRGRLPVGKDDMGGAAASRLTAGGSGVTGNVLGASGGAENMTLTTAMIPAHSHTGTTGNQSANHTHGFQGGVASVFADNSGANAYRGTTGSGALIAATDVNSVNHQHTFTSDNAGGGSAHGNVSPVQVTNWIIKT